MLAYAAGRRRTGERRSSPNALLLIISAHIAVVAALMSAKMDLPSHIPDGPTIVRLIRDERPPPPNVYAPPTPRHLMQPAPAAAKTAVHTQAPTQQLSESGGSTPGTGDVGQVVALPQLPVKLELPPLPVRTAPQLLTPPSELRPPYPQSKILTEEEAVLKLRLSIDPAGRVVAVTPVGEADGVFLDAARRYLIAHWRYKPAMDGDRAVASSIVVMLRFQLDG